MNDKIVSIGPKIRKKTADFYSEYFGKLNTGATWALEEFPYFFRLALSEMRGIFSRGELSMILDVLNGTMMHSAGAYGISGQHVLLSVADSFYLYPGMFEEKWKVSKKDFLDNLGDLSRFQAACLEVWAAGFWQNHESHETTTLEKWVSQLA